MNEPAPEFLNGEMLAKALGVSPRTVRRLTAAQMIPYYRVGVRVMYRKAECVAAFEKMRVKARGEI